MYVWPIRIVQSINDAEIDVNTVDFKPASLSAWTKKVDECAGGQRTFTVVCVFSCSYRCIERPARTSTIEAEKSQRSTTE